MSDNKTLQTEAEEMLQRLYKAKEQELHAIAAALSNLRGAAVVVPQSLPSSGEYVGLGIVEAAERYLSEVGKPQTTREIADALRDRGWRTTSNRPVQAIYATLTNAPKKFRRTEEGLWELVRPTGGENLSPTETELNV